LKLIVKNLDIASRGVLLNRADARNIGVLDGDRVQVINSKNGVSVAAFVETTSTIAQQGTTASRTNAFILKKGLK
jgi:AMP phosphorylase